MPKMNQRDRLDDYAPVAERIELFYRQHPSGRITTKMVSRENRETIVKAFVYRNADDRLAAATGYAAEREGDGEVNTVACLENTETSAVGRALANLGLTASKKRPSREEMAKVERVRSSALSLEPQRTGPSPIIAEFLETLSLAEANGFGHKRGAIIRKFAAHYPRHPMSAGRLVRVEVAIRFWLRSRKL